MRAFRDLLAAQAEIARVLHAHAGAVPALLVVADQGVDLAQDLDVPDDPQADLHVLLHHLFLVRGEPAGLVDPSQTRAKVPTAAEARLLITPP